MPIATTYAELQQLSITDLIRLYDETAKSTAVGLDFIRVEIARREADKQQQQMLRLTEQMRNLTIVIGTLTVINVIAIIVPMCR